MVFVQIPLPVRVLIQRAQCESRFELAAPIVISEAIRLAERFSSAESPRFVNGVLAGISKTERPA